MVAQIFSTIIDPDHDLAWPTQAEFIRPNVSDDRLVRAADFGDLTRYVGVWLDPDAPGRLEVGTQSRG